MSAHGIAEGDDAVALATPAQQTALRRISGRCSVRGQVLCDDGTLVVGFESSGGRDRTAVVAEDGTRLATEDQYGR